MPHATAIAPATLTMPPVNPRPRVGKVCIAIQGKTPGEMIDRAEGSLNDSRFFEFRLDLLPKPAGAIPYIKQFLGEHRDVAVIATCRRKANGGSFTGAL